MLDDQHCSSAMPNVVYSAYRVSQNKPDYLLLLFQFCISTAKHTCMIDTWMYM